MGVPSLESHYRPCSESVGVVVVVVGGGGGGGGGGGVCKSHKGGGRQVERSRGRMSTDSTPRPLSLARGREKSTSFSYEYRIVREKAAVVLELGTAFFKCGFSQEHSPRHVSASTLPAFLRETASARPTFKQWKLYAARVLKWVFFVALQTKPTERPVVLVEDHLMSTYFRRALVTCLFEVFEVPMVLFLPKAVGALTLTGTTTGIVLDVGEHETRVMPVYDSHLLIDAFTYIRLGVSDAKTDLARMIVAQRNELIQSLDPDEFGDVAALAEQVEGVRPEQADSTWIHDITVRLAAVDSKDQIQSDARKQADAIDGGDESKEGDFASSIGGGGAAAAAAISITKDSKWSLLESIFESSPRMHQVVRAGYEVLFSGTIDSEGNTLVTSVLDCLCKCQIDLRSTLAQNIIVVGGGAAAANISFRLQQEIDAVMDALAANEQTKDDAADGEQQQEHSTRPISSNLPFGGRFDNIACLGKYHGVRVRPLAPFNGSLAAWTGTSVFATSNAFNRSQSAENEPMSTPGMSTGRPGGMCLHM